MKGKRPSDRLDSVRTKWHQVLAVGAYFAGIGFLASLPRCFSCAFHVNPLELNESIKFH